MKTGGENEQGVIVLGGGIAGLAAARASGAAVYEAEATAGGTCRSKQVDGFTFDYGIHVLQTDDPVVHDVLDDVGVRLASHERVAHIYSHNTYTAYPFQVNTAGLPLSLRARCLWEYLRRGRFSTTDNYEQWIYKTVGKGFGRTFLIPYSEKFWTVHPRRMTHEWTANRVPRASTWQVLRGALISAQTRVGSNAYFQYPRHGAGYGAMTTLMSESLDEVHLNHRATRIDTAGRRVEFNHGQAVVRYEAMISTIPLPVLVEMASDAPEAVRRAAGLLRCNSIFVVNLGIDRPDLSGGHWAHFPEKDVSFFRISYPHKFEPGMAPEGMSSVAAEVAYSRYRPLDESTIADRVVEDLIRVKAIRASDRVAVLDTIDIKFGYVIYDTNRAAAVRAIHDWLESVSIYPTGRYGRWEYLWSHEALLAGMATAQRCLARRQTAS